MLFYDFQSYQDDGGKASTYGPHTRETCISSICWCPPHTWATAALYKTNAIEPCHLHRHLSTRTPPWESQARSAFQNNGFSGPFIDIFETISHAQTQILNGPQATFPREMQ